MSASVASAVLGAVTLSTSPAAKSVWLDEKAAVVPDAATVAVRNSVPFFLTENEHWLDDQPVAAEGVLETCLAKLGRLPGDLVIEREDVRSIASSIEGELLPNDRS